MHIRKATTEDSYAIAKVHVDTWLDTYPGLVSSDYLNSLNYDNRSERWEKIIESNEDIILIAVSENNEVVGYAYGGKNRDVTSLYDGELYAIYILKSHQRKNIGKHLFRAFIDELKSRNYMSMVIWVLKGNPSYHFYKKMGGRKDKTQDIKVGQQIYNEIAYVWDNLP